MYTTNANGTSCDDSGKLCMACDFEYTKWGIGKTFKDDDWNRLNVTDPNLSPDQIAFNKEYNDHWDERPTEWWTPFNWANYPD